MTGKFTPGSPPKCSEYAQFMKNVGRHEADAIFWTLFILTVIFLIIAAMMFSKAARTHKQSSSDASSDNSSKKHIRKRCLAVTLLCFILSLVCSVVEAFAAFNIEFCDGEDLMMLYWGFWSLLQIGSVIAIFGICLNQWYSLNDKEQPPWDMAMGGPIPVIAALGHAWHICAKGAWHDIKRKTSDAEPSSDLECGEVSRTSTLVPPTPTARHVGYTLDHEPLFALPGGSVATQPSATDYSLGADEISSS